MYIIISLFIQHLALPFKLKDLYILKIKTGNVCLYTIPYSSCWKEIKQLKAFGC